MAIAVYSTVFGSVQGQGGTPFIYTVPVGMVAVIRDFDAFSTPSLLNPVPAVNLMDFTSGGTIWFWANTSAGSQSDSWRGRQVFTAGQQFGFVCRAGPVDCRLSGYLLTAP